MKKYLYCFLTMFVLAGSCAENGTRAAEACTTMLQEDFLSKTGSGTVNLHLVSGKELEVFMVKLNALGERSSLPPIVADTMVVAERINGLIAVALSFQGCMVNDFFFEQSQEDVRAIFKNVGDDSILDVIGKDAS